MSNSIPCYGRDKSLDSSRCTAVFEAGAGRAPVPQENFKPTDETIYAYASPFQQIGERTFASFKAEALARGYDDLPWMTIEHGFVLTATGIAKCNFAYDRFCAAEGVPHDQNELIAALSNAKTIRFFTHIANMSNAENRCYEGYFNLIGSFAKSDFDEFTYNPEEGCFDPSSTLFAYAQGDASKARRSAADDGAEPTTPGVCPAIHLIPKIWRDTVESCRVNGLFTKN